MATKPKIVRVVIESPGGKELVISLQAEIPSAGDGLILAFKRGRGNRFDLHEQLQLLVMEPASKNSNASFSYPLPL